MLRKRTSLLKVIKEEEEFIIKINICRDGNRGFSIASEVDAKVRITQRLGRLSIPDRRDEKYYSHPVFKDYGAGA